MDRDQHSGPVAPKWTIALLIVAISLFAAALSPIVTAWEDLPTIALVYAVFPLIVLWIQKGKTNSRNAGPLAVLIAVIFFSFGGSGVFSLGR